MKYFERCRECEEYDVPFQPKGMGGTSNMCEHCNEYSIVSTKEEEYAPTSTLQTETDN
jgi:hypothetical protein